MPDFPTQEMLQDAFESEQQQAMFEDAYNMESSQERFEDWQESQREVIV